MLTNDAMEQRNKEHRAILEKLARAAQALADVADEERAFLAGVATLRHGLPEPPAGIRAFGLERSDVRMWLVTAKAARLL
jgi:hypothetical protein